MPTAVLFLLSHAQRAYKHPQEAFTVYSELAKVLQHSFPHRAKAYQQAAEALAYNLQKGV